MSVLIETGDAERGDTGIVARVYSELESWKATYGSCKGRELCWELEVMTAEYCGGSELGIAADGGEGANADRVCCAEMDDPDANSTVNDDSRPSSSLSETMRRGGKEGE